jgi:type IV secretion system protein VirB9
MTSRLGFLLLLGLLGSGAPSIAQAEELPWAGRYDARVREVSFRPDEVVAINGSYGVSTMIVLSDDEKIETLALGDSVAWKVEPNKRGNIIFVKPVETNAFSNLNVVTTKRIYSFLLRADFRQGRAQVFKVRFRFPDDEADARLVALAKERARYPNSKNFNVANANSDYAYKGSSLSKPTAVFDDGVKTWFRFAPDQETPAIFVVDRDRKESVVNFHKEGPYIIVDKVNFQWTLRNGEEATCVFNRRLNNLHEPDGLEPYAPERVSSTGFQFW